MFKTGKNVVVNENSITVAYQARATDADDDALIFALPEGLDKDIFQVSPTSGAVMFKNPPNYEMPQDSDKDNIYEVTVSVNDGHHTVLQEVLIQVLDVNDTITGKADVIVEMLNNSTSGSNSMFVFEPNFIKIQPGQTVGFKLTSVGHNSVTELTPNNATGWKINYSDGEVTLQQEGVYLYYCTPHKSLGMYGIVQVGDAALNKTEVIARVNALADQFENTSPNNAQKLREAIAKID